MSDNDNLLKALKIFEQKVLDAAKKNVQQKHDSTKLAESLDAEIKVMPNSIRMFFEMSYYGWFQDQGVKGVKSGRSLSNYSYKSKGGKKGLKGMPPPSVFLKWAKRKGIKGRVDKKWKTAGNKGGQFITDKSLSFLLARSVFNKGIKPSMFFTRPFKEAYKQLPDTLIEAYGEDYFRILSDIIDENLKTT